MKTALLLSGLLVAFATGARAIEVTSVTFAGADDPNGSNVTVTATVAGFSGQAMLLMEVRSTNWISGQLFPPAIITADAGAGVWTHTDWRPYFTGEFDVHVRAVDLSNGYEHVLPTNTMIVRNIGGIVHSVQVPVDTNAAYRPDMAFTNIDPFEVFLHNIGVAASGEGSFSVGCNLLKSWATITNGMTPEQQDIAYTDTSAYRPYGTPFRFDVELHARPTSIMGFGEIRRFVWTPDDPSVPAGPGRLVVDVTSCAPWRNTYSTNLNASVGFAPLFVTDTNEAEQMEGVLMCTSAHYMDVSPTNNPDAVRMGLVVNGHSNTTSYLKAFIPDSQLAQFGITNAELATNALMGYVTHFTSNNVSEGDTTATPPVFTRVPGGTNIVYDYDGDGVGDPGWEARFTFVFHSPVAAEMGPTGETPDSGLSWIAGDFDGDRKSDPAIYLASRGLWYILLSAAGYAPAGLQNFGGTGWTGIAGDYDGDGKADPAVYNAATATMKVQLSSQNYAEASVYDLGGEGYHIIPGDFDGDRKADPAVNRAASGTFFVKLSGHNYAPASISGFGGTGWTQEDGDYDGDRFADMAISHDVNGTWAFALSSKGYLVYEYLAFGYPGFYPVGGDFDGDGKADPTLYRAAIGYWYFTLSGSGYLIYQLPNLGGENCVGVEGDFDGDGKADPAVVNITTGVLTVALSSMGYARADLPLLPQ